MRQAIGVLILLFFIVFFLTGCIDKKELEDRSYITAIGIDLSEENFVLTLNKAGEDIIIRQGATIAEAINEVNRNSNHNVYLGVTGTVILGETVLKNSQKFKETLDTLSRNNELSRDVVVLTTKGTAEEFLSNDLKDEKMIGKYSSVVFDNLSYKTLEDISKSLNRADMALIPLACVSKEHVEIEGLAVVKNFQLLDYLEKLKGYLLITDASEGISITIPPITYGIVKSERDIDFEKGVIDLRLKGTIESYNLEGLFDEDKLKEVKLALEDEIKREIEEVFNLFEKKYRIDAFEFREDMRKKSMGRRNNLNFTANVDVEIISIGAIK